MKRGAYMAVVQVLDKNGKQLTPTKCCGYARLLLKRKKAKVAEKNPFTIQLLCDTPEDIQPLYPEAKEGRANTGTERMTMNGEVTTTKANGGNTPTYNNEESEEKKVFNTDTDFINEVNKRAAESGKSVLPVIQDIITETVGTEGYRAIDKKVYARFSERYKVFSGESYDGDASIRFTGKDPLINAESVTSVSYNDTTDMIDIVFCDARGCKGTEHYYADESAREIYKKVALRNLGDETITLVFADEFMKCLFKLRENERVQACRRNRLADGTGCC